MRITADGDDLATKFAIEFQDCAWWGHVFQAIAIVGGIDFNAFTIFDDNFQNLTNQSFYFLKRVNAMLIIANKEADKPFPIPSTTIKSAFPLPKRRAE